MYLSLNWVKDWLKLPKDKDSQQMALALTMSTVEVEKVMEQAKSLEGLVVGRIEEMVAHPNADRLQVCQVNIGPKIEKIVCGGNNLKKGMLVAVAQVGAKVKWHGEGEPVELKPAKIRGIESNGMIVSSSEVGLGNLFPAKSEAEIIDLSAFRIKPGQPLAEALGLNDTIIEIDNKSINNRPDLWGQYGLARELAAIYKLKLKEAPLPDFKTKNEFKLKVTVEDKENCFRYMGLAINNLRVEDSPWWLKKRLEAVGFRPINNIVDVTNYVMAELGQPLHAFDAQEINGHQIIVKQAVPGSKFVTLDGETRKLPVGALMIADATKNLGLAGIMGGQNSEIKPTTTAIIIESANFKATNIRHTSQDLGLRSESSTRFEKSLDPLLTSKALKRATELILKLCPGASVASHLVDINNNPFPVIDLEVPEELINKRFGVTIPRPEIKDILKRLQFGVEYKAKIFKVRVPSWRATKDISIPEDMVEEVARIYGYNNIQAILPKVTLRPPVYDVALALEKDIKNWLALSQNYNEVYTYAFTDQAWAKKLNFDLAEHLKIKNAITPEQALLNLSLLPNLLARAEENLRWFEEFDIFELERVFSKNEESVYKVDDKLNKFLPKQDKSLAGVAVAKKSAGELFLATKGLMESLLAHWGLDFVMEKVKLPYAKVAYNLRHGEVVLGNFGLLKKDLFDGGSLKVNVCFWQLDFLLAVKYTKQNKKYKSLPKFPSVWRDMAIVIDRQINWGDLAKEIRKVSPLLRQLEPFDIFIDKSLGQNKKSLAFHLEFRSEERTLAASDVDKLMANILSLLKKKFKAFLR
jgi:phenylalanyl-tRNA synthetase beta chain